MKYAKITKTVARELYNANITVLIVGDNVNSFHFESGWHLAYTMSKTRIDANNYDETFDSVVNAFQFHLERELGRRAAYYIHAPITDKAREIIGKRKLEYV